MLTVISPAKKLNFDAVPTKILATLPTVQADAYSLSNIAKQLTVDELRKLMKISEALAKLNLDRFKTFAQDPEAHKIKAAALAFAGDTYTGLEASSLDAEEMTYAQDHLRILSGLYGLLRPMDQIQPYRLEMGSRLATPNGKNLYQYWGDRLSLTLNAEAADVGTDLLLNCASVEYFTAIAPKALKLRVITPVFMEDRDGTCKIVSFFAKKARGAMARVVIQNRITTLEGIKDFDIGGYAYDENLSEGDRVVFTRDYPEKPTA